MSGGRYTLKLCPGTDLEYGGETGLEEGWA